MEQSSKVTVEYHDPSGIFPIVSRDIGTRLPLRNLNWQSPPRPLRQIKSLHVDFVPDSSTQDTLRSSESRTDSDGPNSLDIVRGGPQTRKNAVKGRRHQIPGFRTSPYLKIYVLRCDDKEGYKEHDRRKIREWIRENTPADGKRDDHDACQWMILHVVVPDTIAASEPRWRESVKDPEELKERKSGNKLIGKSSRTVFDRLRADFNESGKAGHDRVAQIRLFRNTIPADLLPTPALAQSYEESSQERENAWNDLITKFKTLILEPFDRRVRQYEADIVEQEARRSLPGWNFCTFFIHKEGLAKALESIGLVEDALAIYDELSIGLETALRDIAAGQTQETATSFAAYTTDLKERISGFPEKYTNGIDEETTDEKRDAAALFSKDYRERIVRSDISVFDFFCYIFSRQKALILRLANARSIRLQLGTDANREGGEDLVLTSEVCWRSSAFIHTAARTLRQDLKSGPIPKTSDNAGVEIESIVCSWIWGVTGQVLEETAVPALLDITKHCSQELPEIENGKPKRPAMSIGLGANTHPQRTTSLPGSKLDHTEKQRPSSRPRTQGDSTRPSSSAGFDSSKAAGLPGQAELATYRAELISMRRKMLEQLAKRRGWHAGWAYAKHAELDKSEDAVLDGDANGSLTAQAEKPVSEYQLLSPALKTALRTERDFQAMFELLTDAAIRHYLAATQSKSAKSLLGDLALLKFQQGEHETALLYFQHIIPFLSSESWDMMELMALHAYAECLKQVQRLDEYVRNALALIKKFIAKKRETNGPRIQLAEGTSSVSQGSDTFAISGLFSAVLAASAALSAVFVEPAEGMFANIDLNGELQHSRDSDAFGLSLQLLHVLDDEIELDEISAILVGHDDPSLEIELANNGPVSIKPGMNTITLTARTVTFGPFLVDKITFIAKRLHFVEERRPSPKPPTLAFTETEPPEVIAGESVKPPPFVLVYPADHAFQAEMRRSRSIHIDGPRHVEVLLNAGQNQIDALEIRMKPTSAGLRLQLADASISGIQHGEEQAKPGQLTLGKFDPGADASVMLPYTIENPRNDITVRLEIRYRVSDVDFVFLRSVRLSDELPLDVEVKDLFQFDTLYSKFSVRTTSQTPFTILEASLKDSPIYTVDIPPALPLPLHVYKSQPVNLVYRVTRRKGPNTNTLRRDAALALEVSYQPIDELFFNCLSKAFGHELRKSDFSGLHRLLLPLLLERARQFIQGVDLEMALLLGECRIPEYDIIGWQELVRTLPDQLQAPLEAWLRQWHSDHSIIPLISTGIDDIATQHITISVDVPNVDIVFGISLNLLESKRPTKSRPPVLVLGQPVWASVRIRHTAGWSAKKVFPNVPTLKIHGEGDTQTSFVCEVGADSEAWIIGGHRRCHFTPQDGDEYCFNVLLVPLKLGMHPLPPIGIQQDSSDPETAYDGADGSLVSCETFYESAGQVVHVLHDLRTTEVHIQESVTPAGLPSSRPGTSSTSAIG